MRLNSVENYYIIVEGSMNRAIKSAVVGSMVIWGREFESLSDPIRGPFRSLSEKKFSELGNNDSSE